MLSSFENGWFVKIYNDLKKDFPLFIYLYKSKERRLEQKGYFYTIKKSTRTQRDGTQS
jgi:hypothetical protein